MAGVRKDLLSRQVRSCLRDKRSQAEDVDEFDM
jgi:hypothetical protein